MKENLSKKMDSAPVESIFLWANRFDSSYRAIILYPKQSIFANGFGGLMLKSYF